MNNNDELTEVIALNANEFPYGVKVTIFLNGTVNFELDIKDKLISLDDELVIQFKLNEHSTSKFTEITVPNFQEWDVSILGFKTKCEAEEAGLKLAESLFWLSISRNFPIRFYKDSVPYTVFSRISGNFSMFTVSGFSHREQQENEKDIVRCIKEIFASKHEPIIDSKQLLLAMELYCSSNLEVTQESEFITLITSIEALSKQDNYKKYISLVENEIKALKEAINSKDAIPETVKKSLVSQIDGLSRESVRQSIKKMMAQHSENTEKLCETAYNTRSKLLHEGKTDKNLTELIPKTSEMIRYIFANCLNLKLSK